MFKTINLTTRVIGIVFNYTWFCRMHWILNLLHYSYGQITGKRSYLVVESMCTVSPSFFQTTIGSGCPFGGLHSMRAVCPWATLVSFGSTRNSSFNTVKIKTKINIASISNINIKYKFVCVCFFFFKQFIFYFRINTSNRIIIVIILFIIRI